MTNSPSDPEEECERCNENEAGESNTCPYKVAAYDNDEHCNCCYVCYAECKERS